DGGSAGERTPADARRRSASGTRLLLPLGSLPVRESGRAGAVDQRAEGIQGSVGLHRRGRRHAVPRGASVAGGGTAGDAQVQRRRPVRERAETIVTFVALADIEA